MSKIALITGIKGQDRSYLSELLLNKEIIFRPENFLKEVSKMIEDKG